MVSDVFEAIIDTVVEDVLILVLMEYGLWLLAIHRLLRLHHVLILVLMEYGLWPFKVFCHWAADSVLILVLMEYGLWPVGQRWRLTLIGLNPCSNGIWSLTTRGGRIDHSNGVLILVLMEYGLWHDNRNTYQLNRCLNPCSNGIWSLTLATGEWVDDGLERLNPCSNGIWSLTIILSIFWSTSVVLILVLMEYGLWPARRFAATSAAAKS